MPERELSQKWWNVIRRKIRATPATESLTVECPDCGTSLMFLLEGRYGRFYKCRRPGCHGTHGAGLDGTPRPIKGSPARLAAQAHAREAVRRLTEWRDGLARERFAAAKAEGRSWWNEREDVAAIYEDVRAILDIAKLDPLAVGRGRAKMKYLHFGYRVLWRDEGLFLRRRSIEDCEKLAAAANRRFLAEIKAEDTRRRIARKHAWDRVLLFDLDTPIENPEDDPASATYPF